MALDGLTACPQTGNSRRLCKPDDVLWSLAVVARTNAHFIHSKPRSGQSARKCRIGRGRPNREDATGLERGPRIGQSMLAVEPVIGLPRQAIGAIVNVEEDRVITACAIPDQYRNIAHANLHARIVKAASG